ncbi:hypothetical protein [Hymenobacter pini]|uniref:hypothetical protein n=1 Tax=Hymenobacter pini TaxID=2880879 RepID=UPI001CF39CD5|nr:hypothetical protein [Hymenobacter pini]MCA8830563.1 hypothetical protein [Hymenobacter pini]
MAHKKFTFEIGTLHVKTKRDHDPDVEKPWRIQYRAKRYGRTLRLSGAYHTREKRDQEFEGFKREEAQPFLRGMLSMLSPAKQPVAAKKTKQK